MTHPKAGQMVYPWYRLDKNVSWFNIVSYPLGIVFGIITFEWITDTKFFIKRIMKPGKFWMPLIYADNYIEIQYNATYPESHKKENDKK